MKNRTSILPDEHFAVRENSVGISPRSKLRPLVSPMVCRCLTRTALRVLLATGLLGATLPAQAARYEFDPRRTEVRFVYKMAFATHRGRFTRVTGVLDYDDKAPEKSRVTAAVAAASLSTEDALVESQLKGAEFFNVKTAPVIAFRSLKVRPHSATSADVLGEVTIKGITKSVILKVKIKPHDDPALKYDVGEHRFLATTRIRRSDFNMTAYESFVGDDVGLVIDAIVRPKRKRRKR